MTTDNPSFDIWEIHFFDSMRKGVDRVRKGEYKAIKIECFNKEEADELDIIFKINYPDIKFLFSWLVFW